MSCWWCPESLAYLWFMLLWYKKVCTARMHKVGPLYFFVKLSHIKIFHLLHVACRTGIIFCVFQAKRRKRGEGELQALGGALCVHSCVVLAPLIHLFCKLVMRFSLCQVSSPYHWSFNPSFCSMKPPGGVLLPPLDGMLVHHRVTLSFHCASTHLCRTPLDISLAAEWATLTK